MNQEHIIFFDGVCNLCNNAVDFIIKRDVQGVFKFAPLQGETAKSLLSREKLESLDSLILYRGGVAFLRSNAAINIAKELSSPWSLISYFKWIPLVLRDGIYNMIAKSRYRLFGKKDTCRLPTKAQKELFLP